MPLPRPSKAHAARSGVRRLVCFGSMSLPFHAAHPLERLGEAALPGVEPPPRLADDIRRLARALTLAALIPLWYQRSMALTLRTDDELEKALTALAEAEGASRQEIIRRAVLERYERSGHAARVEESSARLIERWGDVLDRLGTV